MNVFATPYEVWTRRKTTLKEAVDLHKNHGLSMIEALEVKDKLRYKISMRVAERVRTLLQTKTGRKTRDSRGETEVDVATAAAQS
ncbi:hypothetical protein DBA20_15850 [Pandoraea capi]|nr:hypothetical protein [Pandoraea sp. LA3]MDN4584461.1 hypothetical protein [Pandoraea capi]